MNALLPPAQPARTRPQARPLIRTILRLPGLLLALLLALLLSAGRGGVPRAQAAMTPDATALAPDPAPALQEGLAVLRAGNATAAVQVWEPLAARMASGPLFHGLGDAWLASGQPGRALYWYARAARLIPRNPELRFNREQARLQAGLPEPGPPSPLRPLEALARFLSHAESAWAAVALSLLAGGLFLVPARLAPRTLAACRALVLAAALACAALALSWYAQDALWPRAMVLAPGLSARSGLDDRSPELFVLRPGQTVALEEIRGDRVLVRFDNQRRGWVHRDGLGLL